MALKLTCPNCGSRPHTEFWFGGEVPGPVGDSPRDPPAADRAGVLETDFARVWLRRNSYGLQQERWFHHAGCRRWHTARRNTATNEVDGPA